MEIRFNEDRARIVFDLITQAWIAQRGVFRGVLLPQNRFEPPRDSRECAHWFFFTALTQRGGILSENPFAWLRSLYGETPELFDPQATARGWTRERILTRFSESLSEFWKERKPRSAVLNGRHSLFSELLVEDPASNGAGKIGYKIDQHAASWHHNALVLVNGWSGNVLNVFAGASDFEEAFGRIDSKSRRREDSFQGMRRKIFSLFTIWLQERGIIPVFPTPIPVDFHAMRVLWATGVIDVVGQDSFLFSDKYAGLRAMFARQKVVRVREAAVMDVIAKWSQTFLPRNGFSHLVINPALWVLSRELCVGQLQNGWRSEGAVFLDRGYLAEHPHAIPPEYRDPCGECVLERHCTGAIPSGPYYKWGLLVRLDRIRVLNGKQRELPIFSGRSLPYRPPGRSHN